MGALVQTSNTKKKTGTAATVVAQGTRGKLVQTGTATAKRSFTTTPVSKAKSTTATKATTKTPSLTPTVKTASSAGATSSASKKSTSPMFRQATTSTTPKTTLKSTIAQDLSKGALQQSTQKVSQLKADQQVRTEQRYQRYDVDAAQKQIDALKAQLESEKSKLAPDHTVRSGDGKSYTVKSDRTHSLGGSTAKRKELESQIKNLEGEVSRAKQVQKAKSFASVWDDPDFEETAQKGAAKKGNVVVNSRAHKDVEGRRGRAGKDSHFTSVAYSNMTDAEVKTYNYLYETDEKQAKEYLSFIRETLNQRQGVKEGKLVRDNKSTVGRTVGTAVYGVGAGLDQFGSGAMQFLSSERLPTTATQYGSAYIRQDLADTGPKLPDWAGGASLGQAAYDTVTTTANMAPSILLTALAGPAGVSAVTAETLGSATIGVSAAGNAYNQALAEGHTKTEARLYSTLIGASEAYLQKTFGGITAFGGSLANLPGLEVAINNLDSSLKRLSANLAVKMLSEGGEEYAQDILDPVFRNWFYGEQNDVKLWTPEATYSFLLGAVTSLGLEGVGTVRSEIELNRQGAQIKGAHFDKGLIDSALSLDKETEAYQTAKDMRSGKVKDNTHNVGELFNQYVRAGGDLSIFDAPVSASEVNAAAPAQTNTTLDAVTTAYMNLDMGGSKMSLKTASEKADIVKRYLNGETLTPKDINKLNLTDQNMRRVFENFTSAQLPDNFSSLPQGERIQKLTAIQQQLLAERSANEAAPAAQQSAQVMPAAAEGNFTSPINRAAQSATEAQSAVNQASASTDRDQVLGYNEFTQLLREQDPTISDSAAREIYRAYSAEVGEWLGIPADATIRLKGVNSDMNFNEFEALISRVAEETKQTAPSGLELRAMFSELWKAQSGAQTQQSGAQTRQGNTMTEARRSKFAQESDGSKGLVYDNYVAGEMDSATAEEINTVAKALGVRVRMAEGDEVLGGLANGEIVGNEIRISKTAQNPVLAVIGHEWLHRVQVLAPEQYLAFRNAVMKIPKVAAEAKYLYKYYNKKGVKTSLDEAKDEAAANYAGEMIANTDVLKDFIRKHSEDRTMLEKLRDALHEIAQKLTGKTKQQVQTAESLLQEAFEAAARSNKKAATEGGKARYHLNENFSRQFDEWLNDRDAQGRLKTGGYFNVGTTSDALKSIGVKDYSIYWDKSKIAKIMGKHTEMTADVVKEVPQILEHPILVMQSQTVANRITIYGETVDADGTPVLVAMELRPQDKKGEILDFAKIASAYGKKIAQNAIDTSEILYVDPNKKRTDTWLEALRLQLPAGLTKYGSIGRVTYVDRDVNGNLSFGEDSGKTAMQAAFEKAGVQIDSETESASPSRYSLKTWSESSYVKDRQEAAKALSAQLGVSVRTAQRYIRSVNSIAKMIADDRIRLDYESSPDVSSFVSNAEYGGSIDFSTICAKRRIMTGTFEAIQRELPNTALTAEEVLTIRKMMADRDYQVSCGLCYVEGSRANMGQYTKQFLEQYAKTNPDYLPNMAEMNTATGQEKIRKEHPEVYAAYTKFMNSLAQRKPKLYQLATEYKNEVLEKFGGKKSAATVDAKNRNGGLRLQSFSDFEIIHLLDCMQVITDMSQVGLAGQAYTKVPDFAYALGNTGLKINLSMIAKGVDSSGRIIYDEVEGMAKADAEALRNKYSKNVGTILVVFTDEQLKAALNDPFVDFIIPFHRSQWNSAQYALMGLPEGAKDYTAWQNESYIEPVYNANGKPKRPTNYMPNEYWDFSRSGKENAETYLRMCAANNRKPKFSELLVNNKDGSYSLQPDGSTDGYWKLLIDFKMYSNSGKGSPQMPVRPRFNMREAKRMLNEYGGGHETFPVAQDVVDDFVAQYKSGHQGARFSLKTDSTGRLQGQAVDGTIRKARDTAKGKYWTPNLTQTEWSLLNRRMDAEINDPAHALDEATQWTYANEKGTTAFAIYGIGDGTEATPLYASGGKIATADYQTFVKSGEEFEYGSDRSAEALNRMFKAFRRKQRQVDGSFSTAQRRKAAAGHDRVPIVQGESDGRGSDGNGTGNRGEVKTRFSLKIKHQAPRISKEADEKYMTAVQEGDTWAAQRMVDKAAKAAGYTTQMLYHGTGRFGYTSFDMNAQTASSGLIYATDKANVAANYGGSRDTYAFQRSINKRLMEGDSTEAVIHNAESVLEMKTHVVTEAERKAAINDVVQEFDAIAETLNSIDYDDFAKLPGWNLEDYQDSIANAYDLTMDIVWTVLGEYDTNEDGTWEHSGYDYLKTAARRFEEYYTKLREAVMDSRDAIKGTTLEGLYDLLAKHALYDAAVDAQCTLLPLIKEGATVLTDGKQFREKEALAEAIDRVKDIGTYKLYGNPGNNVLEIDANRCDWLSLKVPEIDDKYHSTDFIAKWAKENGYTSVYVKDVHDGGDKANEYIFFDPEQVKSADSVTYDDNGDIIPLSERFNSNEQDIRYSLKEDSEDNVYEGAVKLQESTIDTYLRDYAAKSSPKYAQAYITYMTPDEFLSLTTSESGRQIVEQQSKKLDAEELGEATRYQPIRLSIDHETGEVQGHEGRHRTVAMRNAGVEQIPVLLFDSSNKYSKSEIAELTLTGQDFGGTWSDAQVRVHDLLPLSYENRDAVVERFANPTNERTLRYSIKDTDPSEARATVEDFVKRYNEQFGEGAADALYQTVKQMERAKARAERKLAQQEESAQAERSRNRQKQKDNATAWMIYHEKNMRTIRQEYRAKLDDARRAKAAAVRDAVNETKVIERATADVRVEAERKKAERQHLADSMNAKKQAAERLRVKEDTYAAEKADARDNTKLRRNAAKAALRDKRRVAEKRAAIETAQGPVDTIRKNPRERTNLERVQEAADSLRTLGRSAYRDFVNQAEAIDRFAKRQKGGTLASTLVNIVGGASTTTETIYKSGLVNRAGDRIGDSMKDVFLCWDGRNKKVDENKQALLQDYMLHKHNIDRMSFVSKAREALETFEAANPWVRDMDAKEFAKLTAMTDKETEKLGKDKPREIAREYAKLLNDYSEARDKPVFPDKNGNPVTADTSAEIAAQYEAENPWLKEKAEGIYEWWDKFMREWVIGDTLSAEDYEIMHEMYPHYVPTYRADKKTLGAANFVGMGGASVGSVVKKAKGGLSEIVNIEDSFANLADKAIRVARTNELYRNLIDTAMLDDAGTFSDMAVFDWEDMDSRHDAYTKPDGEVVLIHKNDFELTDAVSDAEQAGLQKTKDGYVLSARYDGDVRRAYISEELFKSIQNTTGSSANDLERGMLKLGNALTGPMKTAITGINPSFALRNISRDLPTAIVNSISGMAFPKYYAQALREMGANSEHWQQYKALGGTNATYYNDQQGFAKAMAKRDGIGARAVEKMGWFNEVTEAQTRFAEYLATIDRLGDTYENRLLGIKNSAEVTVDFSRKGRYGKVINAWVPYWNPAVQGVDKVFRSVIESPDGSAVWKQALKTVGRASMTTVLIEAVLYAILKAADRYDDWEELSDRVKDTYYCIPLKDQHEFLRIPKNREWGAILGTPIMRLLESANGRSDPFENYVETSLEPNFLPGAILRFGSDRIESDIIGVSQALDLAYNKDFAGRSIIPYAYEQGSTTEQYDADTSMFARKLGELLNFSPMQIDYIVQDYFGDFGDLFTAATSEATWSGDTTVQDYAESVLKTLAGTWASDNRTSNQTVSDYYDMVDNLEKLVQDRKNRLGSDAAKDTVEYQTQKAVEELYGDQISELNRSVRDMADGEEKYGIKEQIAELAGEALSFYDQCMSGQIQNPTLTAEYSELPTSLSNELIRLDGLSDDYSFKPSSYKPSKYNDPDNKNYEYILDDEQKGKYQETYQEVYAELMAEAMNKEQYRHGTDIEKAEILEATRDDVTEETRERFLDWLGENYRSTEKKSKK